MAERFCEALRRARKAQGETLFGLAEALGFSSSYLSDIELDKRPPFSRAKVIEASEHLGVEDGSLLIAAAVSNGFFAFEVDEGTPDCVLEFFQELHAALEKKTPRRDSMLASIVRGVLPA